MGVLQDDDGCPSTAPRPPPPTSGFLLLFHLSPFLTYTAPLTCYLAISPCPYIYGSDEQASGLLPVLKIPALPSQPSPLSTPNSTPFLPSRILHPGPAQPNPAPSLTLGKWVAPSREPR